jgi:pimeloyl-ACP methyl ester carboxylesterase
MPAEEIELMRAQHVAWQVRLGNAHTIPRELDAYARYTFVRERFNSMRTPTLLLLGGDSPEREAANARAVADGLPRARVAVLPGQQHIAMHTAPELFVAEVTRFLAEP